MKVFLSYSSNNLEIATRIARSLKDEGDNVFLDRESLPTGEDYDRRIREAIEGADIFIFLVSPEAISSGSYALAELGIAERASDSKGLKLLPVMVSQSDFESMPPYLRSRTVLQPQGDVLAETLAAAADARREIQRDRVSVTVMVSNSGWILTFYILDDHPREIFYRFADETNFRSTGFTRVPDMKTGLPIPRPQATVPAFAGKRDLFLKYTDSRGRERGPYRLPLDAEQSIVSFVKDVLETTRPWVAYREYPEGRMLLYFTHLLSYKNALKEIRYSVDNETLSNRVRFTPPRHPAEIGIAEEDEVVVEIPMASAYVCVKLVFIDGTEWPPERFDCAIAST